MADKMDGILKEYDALRQEIRSTELSILQVLTIMVGATGVIMGAGFTSRNPGIFVIPIILMLITCLYVADKRWVIWMIAGYLAVFIEDESIGILWENRLAEYRRLCDIRDKKKAQEDKRFKPAANIMIIERKMFKAIGFINYCLVGYFAWLSLISLPALKEGETWFSSQPHVRMIAFGVALIVAYVALISLIRVSNYHFHRLNDASSKDSDVIVIWKKVFTSRNEKDTPAQEPRNSQPTS